MLKEKTQAVVAFKGISGCTCGLIEATLAHSENNCALNALWDMDLPEVLSLSYKSM